MQGFDNPHCRSRILSMNKPLLYSVSHYAEDKPVIIFVPSRKLTRTLARDLITHSYVDENPKRYLHCSSQDLEKILFHVNSRALREYLNLGVGFFHEI